MVTLLQAVRGETKTAILLRKAHDSGKFVSVTFNDKRHWPSAKVDYWGCVNSPNEYHAHLFCFAEQGDVAQDICTATPGLRIVRVAISPFPV